MKTLTICSALVLTLAASWLAAQSKTITGTMKTVTATVEAIESQSRTVTVKKPDGTYEEFYVPETIKKFDTLKIGDKVNARYYENVVVRLKEAGEKATDDQASAVTRAEQGTAGTKAHQRVITATIEAIDPAAPSITFVGPRGWKYTTRVEDTAALAKVKVGDKVDITWTEALVLSLDSAK